MIVSFRYRLIVLSMPKCASTALDEVLAPHADIVIRHPPHLKHMPYRGFKKYIVPLLESRRVERSRMEVVALMREPIDWLSSWYRYRARNELRRPSHPQHHNFTGDVTFREFVDAYLSDNPPPFARVGDPVGFLSDGTKLGPDRVFRYEDGTWMTFLEDRLQRRLEFPRVNVSPTGTSDRDPLLRIRLAAHYVIYEALADDGSIAG